MHYYILTKFLKYFDISITYALDLLRVLTIAEHIRADCPTISESEIYDCLRAKDLDDRLHYLSYLPIDWREKEDLYGLLSLLLPILTRPTKSLRFFLLVFPHIVKNPALFKFADPNHSDFIALLSCLLRVCEWYGSDGLTDEKTLCDLAYLPHKKEWNLLGIKNTDDFFKAWQSVYCFVCEEEPTYTPDILKKSIGIYKKNNVPPSVMLTHFKLMTHILKEAGNESGSELFNPWLALRKSGNHPIAEHGMTQEEILFKDCMYQLVLQGISATDVVNSLFYKNRRDSLVEKNILFATAEIEMHDASNVLVVNPSPDFLVAYSNSPQTRNKRTSFAVTDHTVADAYSAQFSENNAFEFITFNDLSATNKTDTQSPRLYDYVIVMARDAQLKSFKDAFQWCTEQAQLIMFLPQTMMTFKSDKTIIAAFAQNHIYVDSILELPSALSESGKKKKMIVRAHVDDEIPEYFALIPVRYLSRHDDGKTIHYVIPDHAARIIPYDHLNKKQTIKQMISYADKETAIKEETDATKKRYQKGEQVPFSTEIGITLHLYPKPDGSYRAKAYYKYVSDQYGHAVHQKHSKSKSGKTSSNRSVGTPYLDIRSGSLEKIQSGIHEWALKPEIAALITRDLKSHYANRLSDLSLKSVWYCLRDELQSTYMSYNDSLAVQMFRGEGKPLSDLPLRDATEERIMQALQLTIPGGEDDARYRRLLDLIFRVAVKRGYTKINPITHTKTTLDQEHRKAMQQLREALNKESLEYDQIFKILKFLLAPVDEQGTPRAVKESIWLIPLFRLCTAMPLRDLCCLRWQDFHRLDDLDAYQFYITRLVNDANQVVPITTYQHAKKYRKVPSPTILSHVLLLRQQYLKDHYGIALEDALEDPIFLAQEPTTRLSRKERADARCTISQAKSVSVQTIQKAEIPSKVITLLDGDDSFLEDLNATRNDLYRASFVHHAKWACGLSEPMLCYILGRKMPNCYSEHYVDWGHDFLQLDMIQRLDRLWYTVFQPLQESAAYSSTEKASEETHTVISQPSAGQLAAMDLHLVPIVDSAVGDIIIRIESDHGVDGTISAIP